MYQKKRSIVISYVLLFLFSCAPHQQPNELSSLDHFNGEDFNWKALTGHDVFVASRSSESEEVMAKIYSSPAMQELQEARDKMPESLALLTDNFLNELYEDFDKMSEHQQQMLLENSHCGFKVLNKQTDPKRFALIHQKMNKAFTYLRQTKGIRSGYAFVGNIAKSNVGGQKGYIVNMSTGELVELPISSAWHGIGFEEDSERTPLGYFIVYEKYSQPGWQSRTKTTSPKRMFWKLEGQAYTNEALYIYRKSTKTEKAYICSNQFGLIGQNFGAEFVDLEAIKYLRKNPDEFAFIDNSNSGIRQLYLHGTNREDQLGYELSGGCVRMSNLNSFIIKEIVKKQQTMPVFLDAAALHPPKKVNLPGFDTSDLESVYNEQSIVIRKQNMLDSMTLNNKLYTKILPPLANSIAYRMSKIEKQSADVKISINVPFPESAMKYWLHMQDTSDYSHIPFQQHFGFRGEYYKDMLKTSNTHPFFKKYDYEEIKSYFTGRLDDAKGRLQEDLSRAFIKYDLDTAEMFDIVNIEEQTIIDPYFKDDNDSISGIEFLSISDERRRVMHYMGLLDTLATEFPENLENWEHLNWINAYTFLRDNEPGTQPAGEIDYYDAIMAQAYIYAMGERELYEREIKAGKLLPIKGQEFQDYLVSKYGPEGALKLMDEIGLWKLFQYSRSSENTANMKITTVSRPKEEMIWGIHRLAEAYYSKYKWISNQYVITSSVNGQAISLAD
ncbi:L,D-transpeptidase [Flammeovirga sp. MY04]|uniref:L,D-transpeptidase n=1 Tax=Flammeovirga sp. MY04 TaxID=1191459 RepID=UPI00080641A7|nr:L,D-transpeptidase [Flammeovirga sp. MY04]ANQ51081.1 L,D-transpeptidase [Flammeovirga sp. MY04]